MSEYLLQGKVKWSNFIIIMGDGGEGGWWKGDGGILSINYREFQKQLIFCF